jgi:hypothetical protein
VCEKEEEMSEKRKRNEEFHDVKLETLTGPEWEGVIEGHTELTWLMENCKIGRNYKLPGDEVITSSMRQYLGRTLPVEVISIRDLKKFAPHAETARISVLECGNLEDDRLVLLDGDLYSELASFCVSSEFRVGSERFTSRFDEDRNEYLPVDLLNAAHTLFGTIFSDIFDAAALSDPEADVTDETSETKDEMPIDEMQ